MLRTFRNSDMDKKKLIDLQTKLALASIAIPSPAGDLVGLGSDALGYYADPSQRTPLNGLLTLASLLPGIPSSGAARAVTREGIRLGDDLSPAAKAAAKDMPPFEDQMRMVKEVLKGRKLDHLFDAKTGIGQVPNNEDIAKLGRVEYMTPDQYLGLAEKLGRPSEASISYIKEGIAKGKKLGQPTLTVDKGRVVNHDGRHRSMVIKELFGGDVLMPVHVLGDKKTPVAALRPQATDEAFQKADRLLQLSKDRSRGAIDGSAAFMEMLQKELYK